MPELYFAPAKDAARTTVAQFQARLSSAGLSSKAEQDSNDTQWLLLEGYESSFYISTAAEHITLATFNLSSRDDARILEEVERVMEGINFAADETADYT